ncbi:MAG: sugar diacid recognition domain-containing protein [Veillonellales bacterium]
MTIISRELAQKIVNQLMDIVHRNVNIMNCSGLIIASGQSERINTFHQGGKLAVEEKNVVEIQTNEVEHYSGALPGVMWPIDIKKKIVGVVGVTGEPREVRDTAKLVKTVTELILEREMFLADYRSENRVKAQLVDLLFSNQPEGAKEDIKTLAEMLNYRINLPRLVILIALEPAGKDDFCADGLQNLYSARIRETVLNTIKEAACFTDQDISLFYKKNLCIIKSLADDFCEKKLNIFTKSVTGMLKSLQPPLTIQIGIGSPAANESLLRQSYEEALFALSSSPPDQTRSIAEYDILLNYLFENQCGKCASSLALKKIKQKFDEVKSPYDMHKTLDCLLANNLNISATASQLFIHRNTLKFRLEKLKKIVGLDPCHFFQHAMICKFILSMDKKDCC